MKIHIRNQCMVMNMQILLLSQVHFMNNKKFKQEQGFCGESIFHVVGQFSMETLNH